jgi:tRNA pseudouridine38-40 synthase
MTRLMLQVAYDGRNYSGFVPQRNATTVGEVLEAAIAKVDPQHGPLTCSSRTDSGVHANCQIVSFTTDKEINHRGWVLALEQILPSDVSVVAASRVPDEFDPRRDPLWKRYRYRVLQSPVGDPFWFGRAYRVLRPLDMPAMQREAASLVGEHDFSAFRSARDTRESAVRVLTEVSVQTAPFDPRLIDIVVVGNRFLYNMVRIIAGTLVDVGRGRKPTGCCGDALQTGRREDLGLTAPAEGLVLEHVELQTKGLDPWPELETGPGPGRALRD